MYIYIYIYTQRYCISVYILYLQISMHKCIICITLPFLSTNQPQVVASLGREINLNPPLVLGQLPDTSEELLKLDQVQSNLVQYWLSLRKKASQHFSGFLLNMASSKEILRVIRSILGRILTSLYSSCRSSSNPN